MIWTIIFDQSLELVKVIYEGESSVEDSMRAKKEYLSSPYWQPGINILIDFRKTTLIYPGFDELRKTVMFNADRKEDYGANRIAYLVKSTRDYGIARQIAALLEIHTDSKADVFMDEFKAMKWLALKVPEERSPILK